MRQERRRIIVAWCTDGVLGELLYQIWLVHCALIDLHNTHNFTKLVTMKHQNKWNEPLSTVFVLRKGLDLLGHYYDSTSRTVTLLEDFGSLYGSHPMVLRAIWNDLLDDNIRESKLDNKDKSERGFSMYMVSQYFLWTYPKNRKVLVNAFSFLSERASYGELLWRWIEKVANLKSIKIKLSNVNGDKIFIISVDAVDFQIWEKMHPLYNKDKRMCSHKFKSAGLKYEIALSVYDSSCVWISGPFRCGKHDATIFKGKEDKYDLKLRRELRISPRKALQDMVPKGKLAVADAIYSSCERVSVPNQCDTKRLHNHKARIRCRQETYNK